MPPDITAAATVLWPPKTKENIHREIMTLQPQMMSNAVVKLRFIRNACSNSQRTSTTTRKFMAFFVLAIGRTRRHEQQCFVYYDPGHNEFSMAQWLLNATHRRANVKIKTTMGKNKQQLFIVFILWGRRERESGGKPAQE